jgi:hypothetical protein
LGSRLAIRGSVSFKPLIQATPSHLGQIFAMSLERASKGIGQLSRILPAPGLNVMNGSHLAEFDDPGCDQEPAFHVRINKLEHQAAGNRQRCEDRSGDVWLDVTVTTRRCDGANG